MKGGPLFLQTAKDSSVEKLLQKLCTWYLEKEGKIELFLWGFFFFRESITMLSQCLVFDLA